MDHRPGFESDEPEIVEILPPRPPKADRGPGGPRRAVRPPRISSAQMLTSHGALALFLVGIMSGAGLTRAALAPPPAPSASPASTADASGDPSASGASARPTATTSRPPLADGRRSFDTSEGMPQDDWSVGLQAFAERLPPEVTALSVQQWSMPGLGDRWEVVATGGAALRTYFLGLAAELRSVDPDTAGPIERPDGNLRSAVPGFRATLSSALAIADATTPAEIRYTLTLEVDLRALDATGHVVAVADGVPADMSCTLVDTPSGFAAEVADLLADRGAAGVQVVTACSGDRTRATIVLGWIEGDPLDLAAAVAARFTAHGVAAELAGPYDFDGTIYGSLTAALLRKGMVGHEADGQGIASAFWVRPELLRPDRLAFVVSLVPSDLDASGRLLPDPAP
jgi:hypothetical protein